MKNVLKYIWKEYGACIILITTFMTLCYYKVPMVIGTKFSNAILNLLEKYGVNVHRTITPDEYFTFLLVITVVMLVAAFVFGKNTDDKECAK